MNKYDIKAKLEAIVASDDSNRQKAHDAANYLQIANMCQHDPSMMCDLTDAEIEQYRVLVATWRL